MGETFSKNVIRRYTSILQLEERSYERGADISSIGLQGPESDKQTKTLIGILGPGGKSSLLSETEWTPSGLPPALSQKVSTSQTCACEAEENTVPSIKELAVLHQNALEVFRWLSYLSIQQCVFPGPTHGSRFFSLR